MKKVKQNFSHSVFGSLIQFSTEYSPYYKFDTQDLVFNYLLKAVMNLTTSKI